MFRVFLTPLNGLMDKSNKKLYTTIPINNTDHGYLKLNTVHIILINSLTKTLLI